MSVHDGPVPDPTYPPTGFVHRLDAYGTDTAAFGFDSRQIARIFTRDLDLGVVDAPASHRVGPA